MVADEDPELEQVLERAFPGASISSRRRLAGGISARATLVEVVLQDASRCRVVVRRPRHDTREGARAIARSEHALLTQCAALGAPVPRPRYLDVAAAAVVLDFVEGEPDLSSEPSPGMLQQLATALARIHALPLLGQLAHLPRRRVSAGRLITEPPALLDASLDEAGLRQTLASLWPWPEHNQDVLLHGDYWPGNVVFDRGRLAAVLDWEEAELGDPLADVALTRLDLLWAFGEAAADTFTAHYREQIRIDWRNLARWELAIALRPMGALSRWAEAYTAPPLSRPDISAAAMARGHQRFVRSALSRL